MLYDGFEDPKLKLGVLPKKDLEKSPDPVPPQQGLGLWKIERSILFQDLFKPVQISPVDRLEETLNAIFRCHLSLLY